jgi:uncharacterized phage protein (TIGR01671 family)
MRTIKFRGKDVKTGEWVYGDLHTLCDKQHIHTEHTTYPFAGRRSFIDPDTVGQFTGLTDKDGKEIYEGDIVRSTNSNEFVYEVVYEDKRFASFGLRRKQDVFMHYFGEAIEADECEVVGSVFDNPDLIEKGGQDE